MADRIYKATKTRSDRPGWSVIFNHPRRRDARGKYGLKVRRGLGTQDENEANRLVEQLNQILANEYWWSHDRRIEANLQFENIVVSAFFDGIEVSKSDSKDLREQQIPMPTREEGYARVMLVGSTGAGKTTLLRQLIGTHPQKDRFPSTSTAKTTTADIEIITDSKGPYRAAITFMTEHETRCYVEECLEEACSDVLRTQDDEGIANSLLEHKEQRFRLSYLLGAWEALPQSGDEDEDAYEFDEDDPDEESLADDEIVPSDEQTRNQNHLCEYVNRIRKVTETIHDQVAEQYDDFQNMQNAQQRQDWLEHFNSKLYSNEGFEQLSLDIMDAIRERFDIAKRDKLSPALTKSSANWPTLWFYENSNRNNFLKQVKWFTGNHYLQFGRLLTPLVDGIRVRGPFHPATPELRENSERQLVLLDGEGMGHSAKEAVAVSVSTKITEKFSAVTMILLVDNAEAPMQAASLDLLHSIGVSGHGHKLAVAFTHFDQVKGDNLRNYQQKKNHVRASISNAVAGLRESLGPPVEILEQHLKSRDFYLGGLDKETRKLPKGMKSDLGKLLSLMQESAQPVDPSNVGPMYNIAKLELALRDATDGFKTPWLSRLGLRYHEGIDKEHWGRVKALCRRIAFAWTDEYNDLKPVADFVNQLQTRISLWLEEPYGWAVTPQDEKVRWDAINEIRQEVFSQIHGLAHQRLIRDRRIDWTTAFEFRGRGSSVDRAKTMVQIYDKAAPSISSAMDVSTQEFLNEVVEIVKSAITDSGGSFK